MNKCIKKDCGKVALPTSKFCGEHISNKELKQIFQNLKLEKKPSNLEFTYVSIKSITIGGTIKNKFAHVVTNH